MDLYHDRATVHKGRLVGACVGLREGKGKAAGRIAANGRAHDRDGRAGRGARWEGGTREGGTAQGEGRG